MQTFPEKIKRFLESQHVMSISVLWDNATWSATCFYVLDVENVRLVFVSSPETIHAQAMLKQNNISGTISNNELKIRKIQGIQFTGKAFLADSEYLKRAKFLFLKQFPVARLKKTIYWYIELEYVKMTDNTFSFASKTHWKRNT